MAAFVFDVVHVLGHGFGGEDYYGVPTDSLSPFLNLSFPLITSGIT